MAGPSGLLGVRWRTDAGRAVRRLGLACAEWQPVVGASGFEACADLDHPVTAFGRTAIARLIRDDAGIAGLELTFRSCGADWPALHAAVAKELRLSTDESDHDAGGAAHESLYQTWGDGRAVHLAPPDAQGACVLTVAGPVYGRVFSGLLLRGGLANVATGLSPR